MITCMAHRGPDGSQVWNNEDGSVAMGHRRLAIIDLSPAGAQPMHYLNRYYITHNGEIYNYTELRNLLLAKGYTFRSQSDTEVILAAYDHWKKDCLQYLEGMFAFAIWDEKEQTLFAARDRFGEKPFFYTYDADEFCFASEIKSLINIGCERSINHTLLLQYLANGFAQDAMNPAATFYKGIQKLPARHYLLFNKATQELDIAPYFDIDKAVTATRTENAVQQFRELFFQSVDRRLRSDVEIGTSLSGGLDSSAVVAAIHQLKQQSAVQKTFTASFPGFEKDETAHAQSVATAFGLQQFFTSPSADDMITDLEKFLQQHDEPVSSASVYAQYKVYELARQQGIKVVLDGQGADEILSGYTRYVQWYLQDVYRNNAGNLSTEMQAFGINAFGWKHKLAAKFPGWTAIQLEKKAVKQQKQSFFNTDYIAAHLTKAAIHKPVVHSLNDVLYDDVFGGRLEELLRNADRNSMAHGIEVRLPFLDHQLVQFIFSLPVEYKMHNGFSKYLLRTTMDGLLPQNIVWRKDKVGFEPPQQQWMQHTAMQEKVQDAKASLVKAGILHKSALTRPVQPTAAHAADNYDWRFLSVAQLV